MMKKITLLFICCLASFTAVNAQINVTVDATSDWNGFVNAFDFGSTTPAASFSYPVEDLRTDIDGNTNSVTVFPNFLIWDLNDDTPGSGEFDAEWNPFWFSEPGVPNKNVELNSFVQEDREVAPEFFNQDITFSGNVDNIDVDLTVHAVQAFIKVFPADFSSSRVYIVDLDTEGGFSVTAPSSEFVAGDRFLQYGFVVFGPIADDALEGTEDYGGLEITPLLLSNSEFEINDLTVSPNPTNNDWILSASQTIESVKVYDILGKEVMSINPNLTEVSIDASQLNSGIYLARIASASGTKTMKLVRN